MKLFIKQRIFSWKNKFDIRDENGTVKYYCESELFTISKKLHIFDENMQKVAYIKQNLMSLTPCYEIYIHENYAATLVKKITFLTHDYYYKNLDWKINGNFFAHNYSVFDGNKQVMQLSKQWLNWGDTYMLDIHDNNNDLLCLASSIVIDCVCHSN